MEEVLVIGGGIAGCATAYYLASDGVPVRLLERGELNGLASGANAGSLHAQIPHDPFRNKGAAWARSFAPAVRLFKASLEIWRGLEAELGTDLEVTFGGGLLVAANEAEMREIVEKAAIERAAGLDVELLNLSDLRRLAPYLSDASVGGAFCDVEGKANPLLVAPAFAAAARARGARFETVGGFANISREKSGYAVETTGGTYRAQRVILAAGVATGSLVASLGGAIEIQAFPIQVSVTEPAEPLLPHLVYCAGEKLTMKQTRLGTILIGGGWSARLDERGRPTVDPVTLAANLAVACRVVPGIGSLTLTRSWAAVVNGTENWLPILGELTGAPGVFVNYVPWMGFTGGPAAARAIADMAQGRAPSIDAPFAAFRP